MGDVKRVKLCKLVFVIVTLKLLLIINSPALSPESKMLF